MPGSEARDYANILQEHIQVPLVWITRMLAPGAIITAYHGSEPFQIDILIQVSIHIREIMRTTRGMQPSYIGSINSHHLSTRL